MAAGNPSRTGIRRPTTRTAKIVWVAIGVGVLAALVGTILNSTNEQPLPDSPQDATQIESAFQNSGITLTKYEYSNGRVTCAIDTGEWVTVGPANLRVHLAGSLQELYTLAQKYPEIEDIYVDLNSPSSAGNDEYGHELPAGVARMAFLKINADDLRKFPEDFKWSLYPVYVANRYVQSETDINWSIRDVWQSELSEETRLGSFR